VLESDESKGLRESKKSKESEALQELQKSRRIC